MKYACLLEVGINYSRQWENNKAPNDYLIQNIHKERSKPMYLLTYSVQVRHL